MNYYVLGIIFNIWLVRNWMSGRITWVFGLAVCMGLYGIQILTGLQQGLLRCKHDLRIILEEHNSNGMARYGTVL
jgi:hypothetical protein